MVKFHSSQPHLSIGRRELRLPIRNAKEMCSTIDFDINSELVTDDPELIEALRFYIEQRPKWCAIWEDGEECKPYPIPQETPEKEPEKVLSKEEIVTEIQRLLRL